jgi:hypothetical protein
MEGREVGGEAGGEKEIMDGHIIDIGEEVQGQGFEGPMRKKEKRENLSLG